jgi:hypothetical protein
MTLDELASAINALATATPPVGTVVAFAGEILDTAGIVEVRPGWLLCNGAAVRDADFPALFQAIQASHGNGQDSDFPLPGASFNLPDYRGLFLRGVNGNKAGPFSDPEHSNADRPANHLGGNIGNRVGSVQLDEGKSHNHQINDPGHSHSFDAFRTPGAGAVGQAFPNNSNGFGTGPAITHITIQNSGGSESRPKNAYVHYLIRAR